MVITYSRLLELEKSGFTVYGNYAEISGLFAYDAYNILFAALAASAKMTADGRMTIPRQKLRNSIGEITVFAGLAGSYACNGGTSCLKMDNFLDVRLPIH